MRVDELHIIDNYLSLFGKKGVWISNIFSALINYSKSNRAQTVFLTNSRVTRKSLALLGADSRYYSMVLEESLRTLAFVDTCVMLNKKGVSIYFYNRIDEILGYKYEKRAQERIQQGISFPKMLDNLDDYEDDLKTLLGKNVSRKYVEGISHIPQVIKKGDIYCHEDYASELVNVVDGKRITTDSPADYRCSLYMYGRCGVFGYAVEDKYTVPSRLQQLLKSEGINNMRVVNRGLWGGDDYMIDHDFFVDSEMIKKGDIIVFYRCQFEPEVMDIIKKSGVWYKDLTEEWHANPKAKWCFFDRPGHMNQDGYEIVSELMLCDMQAKNFGLKKISEDLPSIYVGALDSYRRKNGYNTLEKKIYDYVSRIYNLHPCLKESDNNGAIVMNCNPFTYGHRYLVESSAKVCDYLIVFVVEENKSFFEYADRYNMVVEGLKDLNNVLVVPSGSFIISAYTFPEYFLKDYVKEKDFDVSNDVTIFGKYIAPMIKIKKRFVGEEPFDPVTARYNETMKRILPDYMVELVEIPRGKLNNGSVISATKVRELMKVGNYEELKNYVPDSTYRIIKEKYI